MSFPVCDAVERGDLAAVRSLVENQGGDVSERGRYGWTPLMWAAVRGRLPMVEYLLERAADKETKDNNGNSPLLWAAMNGHVPVVEHLVERGANMEAKDNYGNSPLLWAAMNGHVPAVKYLVERGADLEAKNNIGSTTLMYAAEKGHVPMVKYLLERGADLEAKNNIGSAPLFSAAEKGHLPMVKCLLERGADLEATDKGGYTPLMKAARQGKSDVVTYLCACGADVRALDTDGHTVLYHVGVSLSRQASNTMIEIIATLLYYGGDLSAITLSGQTASQVLSARLTNGDQSQLLKQIQKVRPIVAINVGDLAELRRLFECEAVDMNASDYLIYATRRADWSMFEYLLERGAVVISMTESDADAQAVHGLVQRRESWIDAAWLLAHQYRVSLTAVRTIHEYVVGFNWSAVCEAIA